MENRTLGNFLANASPQVMCLWRHWHVALHQENDAFRTINAWPDFNVNDTFEWLVQQYQEPHRKYHNLNHLSFLFELPEFHYANEELKLDFKNDKCFNIIKTLFFFFHDSIYNIPATDNEHLSANEAFDRINRMGFLDVKIRNFVCETIELSNHTTSTSDPWQQLLLDADLAILGASPEAYLEYTANVRNEYSIVPDDIWKEKRIEFLEYMLNKGRIFQHPLFFAKYESKALLNMSIECIHLQAQNIL